MQCVRIALRQVKKEYRPGLPFNERADGGSLSLADDEITFLTLLVSGFS